jgi:L-malate glycosyltransferase
VKLKIAYFIDRIIQGGTELQLVQQINELSARGIEQELFCLYKSREHESVEVNCKVNILEVQKLVSLRCVREFSRSRRYLRKNGFSIVQTYFFDSTMFGVLAGRLASRGIKVVSCRRDMGFWYTPQLVVFLRIINRLTDRIVANSTAVRNNVIATERADPGQVDIIPNGISLDEFCYSRDSRRNSRSALDVKDTDIFVGIIGNMSREVKRIDLFVKAATYALEKKANLKFVILGDGRLKQKLKEMVRTLGVDCNVMFLGRQVSKHRVLSAIDIGVVTSDSEGLSNAIMEYMAAGLPVVATRVGGNQDLVRENETGFLVAPNSYEQIGEAIILLAGDAKLRSRLGENGRKQIADYGWEIVADKTIKYYRRLARP